MADAEGEEQKPNVSGAPEHLNLQVRSQVCYSLHAVTVPCTCGTCVGLVTDLQGPTSR